MPAVLALLAMAHPSPVARVRKADAYLCPDAMPFDLGYESAIGALPIPDNTPAGVNDCMAVPTSPIQSIADLQVAVTITHSWVGDLIITLTHTETGTSVVLLDRPGLTLGTFGCGNDNIRVTFSDAAAELANDQCSSTPPAIYGTFRPSEPLSAFDGEEIGGNWVLNVSDNSSQDTGTIESWTLLPTYQFLPPPPPPVTDTPTPANTPPQPTNTPVNTNTPQPTNTPAAPTNTPAPDAQPGDASCDGSVNAIDAAYILQYSAGLLGDLPCPDAADVNHDGMVNAVDSALILQYSAGLLPSL